MALFTFNVEDVRRCVNHCKAAPNHDTYYGEKVGPVLYLVGDSGVYLMSNGIPGDAIDPATQDDKFFKRFVAYADGINPSVDEDWYDTKRDLFGGDDGAEPIPLALFELALRTAKKFIWVKMTANHIEVKA